MLVEENGRMVKPSQAQQEPVTDEENEKFSRDVSNFKGADPEATKYALQEFLKNRVPAIGDIRALKHRIHALEGDVIGYKQMLDAAEQPAQQEPVGCEGAVVNGRVYADCLEHHYKFECEAGPLHMCTDWVEFRRCFEWLAQHTSPPAQRTWVGLTDEDIAEEDWHLSADRKYEEWTLQKQLVVCGVKDFARAIEAKLKAKNSP